MSSVPVESKGATNKALGPPPARSAALLICHCAACPLPDLVTSRRHGLARVKKTLWKHGWWVLNIPCLSHPWDGSQYRDKKYKQPCFQMHRTDIYIQGSASTWAFKGGRHILRQCSTSLWQAGGLVESLLTRPYFIVRQTRVKSSFQGREHSVDISCVTGCIDSASGNGSCSPITGSWPGHAKGWCTRSNLLAIPQLRAPY